MAAYPYRIELATPTDAACPEDVEFTAAELRVAYDPGKEGTLGEYWRYEQQCEETPTETERASETVSDREPTGNRHSVPATALRADRTGHGCLARCEYEANGPSRAEACTLSASTCAIAAGVCPTLGRPSPRRPRFGSKGTGSQRGTG